MTTSEVGLAGKRLLVTGAGGSIGSALCRHLTGLGADRVVMLDHDETALHTLLLELTGRAELDSPDVVLADVRDAPRLLEVFAEHRPHVVLHTAALKHLAVLERHPGEAAKTNVLGTANVLRAAEAVVVERFVNISTDKAADPTSVLGLSKALAEQLTAGAGTAGGTYVSVRFGNVLGTRGSALTTFAAQIAAGHPVTLTDPEATRYFMTVDEAVRLVLQAAAVGKPGETLVLDTGEPVRIADVVARMVDEARADVPVVVTGLARGEKRHEARLGAGEPDVRPEHPSVSHVPGSPLPPAVEAELLDTDPASMLERYAALRSDPLS